MSDDAPSGRGSVVGPMGRREALSKQPRGGKRPREGSRPSPLPRPKIRGVLPAMVAWALGLLKYTIVSQFDRARGVDGVERRAVRVRRQLEARGSVAIKIGKQLAMRIDLIPVSFMVQLTRMPDVAPAIDFEAARARIEDAIGGPLETVFSRLDPEPISSTSVQCIYQALLLDGRQVAVKVRRPGIRQRLVNELAGLTAVLRVLELMTVLRPGLLRYLRSELLELAGEELNYAQQVRYMSLFREKTRAARIKYASAPRAYPALSNHSVMVTDFEGGIRLSELVRLAKYGDAVQLAEMAASHGIDLKRIARRLLRLSWWSIFENLFFIAEPTAENIVIQPGNRLVFLDFEDCGTLTSRNQRHYFRALQALARDDGSGAATAMVQLFSPLPFIDVNDFGKRIEADLWYELFAMRDREAEWWEHSTLSMWRSVLRVTRDEGVNVRLDVLHMIRSSLAFDTLAARIWPRIKFLDEFERYAHRRDKRAVREVIDDLSDSEPEDLQVKVIAEVTRGLDRLRRASYWLEASLDNIPVANLALAGKAATVTAELVRFGARVATLLGVGVVGHSVLGAETGAGLVGSLQVVAAHPAFLAVGLGMAFLSVRRILFRLDDTSE